MHWTPKRQTFNQNVSRVSVVDIGKVLGQDPSNKIMSAVFKNVSAYYVHVADPTDSGT